MVTTPSTAKMIKDLDCYLSEDFLTNYSEFMFIDSFTKRTYKIFSVHQMQMLIFVNASFEENEVTHFFDRLKDESIFRWRLQFLQRITS